MPSSIVSLSSRQFGGINRNNSKFDDSKITCSDCQNVELYYTDSNSGVGLRTAKGNKSITSTKINEEIVSCIPADEEIIEIFETVQLGNKHLIVYTVSESQGRLYEYDLLDNTLNLILDGLKSERRASGCDFTQGVLDMFVFSNGVDLKYIYSNIETLETLKVEEDANLHLSYDNITVRGLGLVVFDSRLWIFSDKTLFYSDQRDCRNFVPEQDTTNITSAGNIPLVKNITAIHQYLGSLAIFHSDSSCLLTTDATTKFKISEESPGGCASHKALVFHGVDLYFYDDTKKGVFSFQQIVNGDKTLGENIALDIQNELITINEIDVDNIKATSVITADRNEVWFLLPISSDNRYSIVMIYDYLRGEWLKRKCQKINCVSVYKSKLYSAGKEIYEEYVDNYFNNEYIEHFYTCSILNFLSDTSLKITKFPPRISVDSAYKNDFLVQYVKNYDILKKPKIKLIKSKSAKNIFRYNTGITYNSGYRYKPTSVTQVCKLPSANFKALQIKFYTEEKEQDFCIKMIEFTKIRIKQI